MSCGLFKTSLIKPKEIDYCVPLAKELCPPLPDPLIEDAAKTSGIYAAEYADCQLKHEILVACTQGVQKEKAR